MARMAEDVFEVDLVDEDPFKIERIWRRVHSAVFIASRYFADGRDERAGNGLLGYYRQGG